jgi:hypothetical protein
MVAINDRNSTAFEILGLGLLTRASRGIKCRYVPIPNGTIHYDVWGVASSTARQAFNLYSITLSCQDIWPPGFAGLSKGDQYTIYGTDDWIQPCNGGRLIRPCADGVLTYLDSAEQNIYYTAGTVPPGAEWIRYRPKFNTILEDWSIDNNEYEDSSWSITFKETR